MQINIIGNYFGIDGFSNHTRQLAVALDKLKDIDVSMLCNRHQGWEGQVNDQELQMMLRDPEEANINLMIGQPQHWRLYSTENKPFIGFLVWEGDKIPEYWIEYLLDENVKQIWVPSQHVKDAIMKTIIDNKTFFHKEYLEEFINKIHKIPHGVDLDIFYPINSQRKKDNDDVHNVSLSGATKQLQGKKIKDEHMPVTVDNHVDIFKFFTDKGWRSLLDRGGTQDTVQAFLEEFTDKDKVELIIKINPAYPVGNMQEMISQLKPKDKTSFAPIKLIKDAVPFEKLNEIYNMGDIFVNSSKAEAFHLGCLQAMACGIPVISNNFGGQTDYINDKNGWLLKEGTMKEVIHELEYEGISWKDVNIMELRKVMRKTYNDYFLEYDEKAVIALGKDFSSKKQKSIETAKEFTWDKSAEKAYANLKSISIK